jgi:hypothetical protein
MFDLHSGGVIQTPEKLTLSVAANLAESVSPYCAKYKVIDVALHYTGALLQPHCKTSHPLLQGTWPQPHQRTSSARAKADRIVDGEIPR